MSKTTGTKYFHSHSPKDNAESYQEFLWENPNVKIISVNTFPDNTLLVTYEQNIGSNRSIPVFEME